MEAAQLNLLCSIVSIFPARGIYSIKELLNCIAIAGVSVAH